MPRKKKYLATWKRRGTAIAAAIVVVAGGGVAALNYPSARPNAAAPNFFMTSPAPGAAVSGASVNVAGTCGAKAGVTGVQFKLDGGNLLAEDTSAPYQITWDSTSSTNGTHTITAVCRDPAGLTNSASPSSSVTVTVSGAGGGGSLANVWVAATGSNAGVNCPRSSTPIAQPTASTVCLTLNKGYQVANPGDTVGVVCGNYGTQTFLNDATKNGTTSYITYQPSDGTNTCWNQTGPINFGTLGGATGPAYITLNKVEFNGGIGTTIASSTTDFAVLTYEKADHVVVDGQNGGRFDVDGSSNVTMKNGQYGNCSPTGAAGSDFCLPRVFGEASNVVVSGNTLRGIRENAGGDATCTPNPPGVCHVDGIAVFGCQGCMIDGNKFYDDDITDIRVQNPGNGGFNNNITIQNNWLGIPWNGGAAQSPIQVDTQTTGLVIRFNSTSGNASNSGNHAQYLQCTGASTTAQGGSGCGTPADHAKIYGNTIGGNAGCPTNADFSYDVFIPFSGGTGQTGCGVTDVKVASFPYTSDPTSGDINFNITGPTWAGDNLVPTASFPGFPTADYNSATRPHDAGTADAGSVER